MFTHYPYNWLLISLHGNVIIPEIVRNDMHMICKKKTLQQKHDYFRLARYNALPNIFCTILSLMVGSFLLQNSSARSGYLIVQVRESSGVKIEEK